jgi:DNA-binding NtrC family response regulator
MAQRIVDSLDLPMNENVLIAANESIQIRGVLQGLRDIGIKARLLPSARSAMAFLQDRWPAVVVLDKALTDVSSLNLCRAELREEQNGPWFCFYWMTSTINSARSSWGLQIV